MSAANHPNTALLRACALDGQRGQRRLFTGLSLALHPGDVVWLRGRNGRGKTTLLRILAGLASPSAGAIELDGGGPRDQTARRQLLYIGHNPALKDDLTASEALRFLCALSGPAPSDAALKAALGRLGVADRARAPVRTLSQGQRRRVALARLALEASARIWLLDEPFDALDDQGIVALNALLTEHSQQGGATLLTSHQALSLSDPAPVVFSLDAFSPAAAAR